MLRSRSLTMMPGAHGRVCDIDHIGVGTPGYSRARGRSDRLLRLAVTPNGYASVTSASAKPSWSLAPTVWTAVAVTRGSAAGNS